MRSTLRTAAVIGASSGVLAVAEIVWFVFFLGQSSDGPAFVMALVAEVLIPTLLTAAVAVLAEVIPSRTRVAATAAVAASGLAVAGVQAGVFVGDDPTDPSFIFWVASVPQFAFVAAVLFAGFAGWGLLRPLPLVGRAVVTVLVAVVAPVILVLGLFTALPLVVMLAGGVLFALIVVVAITTWRPRRRARI